MNFVLDDLNLFNAKWSLGSNICSKQKHLELQSKTAKEIGNDQLAYNIALG